MISVLSNIVLVAGFGNFAYSYYISRKENMYDNLFKEIEKCQKYHLDYVEKVDQLPSDRNLLLFGTPHSLTAEKIITKTYIKKNESEDRLWHFDFKDKFNLTTAAK